MPRKNELTQSEELALQQVKYRKSNRIINARGKSSALVQKLFTVGITHIRQDKDGAIVARITGQELRAIFRNYTGSFYDAVKTACDSEDAQKPDLMSWRIRIADKEHNEWKSTNVVTEASFKNGMLNIVFNQSIKDDIFNVKTQYTELYQNVTIQLKSPYSIQLYEKFQSEMDYQRATRHNQNGPYYVIYPIDEMRDMFSLDFDRTIKGKKVEYHLYKNFPDFRKHVLDVAEAELNEISPIKMQYEVIKAGRGAKAQSVKFTLIRKQQEETESISEEEELRRKIVYADASVLLLSKVRDIEDIRAICETADYDLEKIKKACDVVDNSNLDKIKNMTGFLISAIQNNYKPAEKDDAEERPAKTKRKSSAGRKKKSAEFMQTEYDFDEIEKNLLNN